MKSLIFFAIISIIFNNLKKKNQHKSIDKNNSNEENVQTYEEYEEEYHRSEMNEVLRELKGSFRSVEEKIPDQLMGELKNKREHTSSCQSQYQERKDNRTKKLEEQRTSNKELQKKKKRLIPENYQSGEGRSANPNYMRKDPMEETAIEGSSIEKSGIQDIDERIKSEETIYFTSSADLKRAMILKEILDKPVSLRK